MLCVYVCSVVIIHVYIRWYEFYRIVLLYWFFRIGCLKWIINTPWTDNAWCQLNIALAVCLLQEEWPSWIQRWRERCKRSRLSIQNCFPINFAAICWSYCDSLTNVTISFIMSENLPTVLTFPFCYHILLISNHLFHFYVHQFLWCNFEIFISWSNPSGSLPTNNQKYVFGMR